MLRLVINLKRSVNRWNAMETQLNQLAIQAERVDAVDGRLLLPEEIAEKTRLHYKLGRKMAPGEVGCFLSHRKCWEALLQSNEKYALVMEDDLLLSERSSKFMQSDLWIPEECHLIQLFVFRKQKSFLCEKKELDLGDGDKLWRPIFPTPVGAQAYIISREAAELALQHSQVMQLPSDEFLFVESPVADRFPCYRLNHAVVMDAVVASDINKSKKRTHTNFWFEGRRFWSRMQSSLQKKWGKLTGRYVMRQFDYR